jgi:hypothetical protein
VREKHGFAFMLPNEKYFPCLMYVSSRVMMNRAKDSFKQIECFWQLCGWQTQRDVNQNFGKIVLQDYVCAL